MIDGGRGERRRGSRITDAVSRWSPTRKEVTGAPWGESRIRAFIDLGTNSVRMVLVRFQADHAFSILSQQKEVVRLGEDEFVDRHLRPDAMTRAALVCRTFAEMARAYGAEEIVAVATSATREARNQDEFLRRLRRDAGLEVRTISGREEARLIYLGVSSGVHLGPRRALFIDVGGGSTELIVGDQLNHKLLDSVRLGAIRLTSLFFMPSETGPVTSDRYALIRRYVDNAVVRSMQRVRELNPEVAIGSSGTIETLADMAMRLCHDRPRRPDDVLRREDLARLVPEMCRRSLDERRKLPGISPERADIIVAGAAIVEGLMEGAGIESVRVSDRGLREGLIIDHLARRHPALLEGLTVRERSVLQLGRRCNFAEPHARQVTGLALALFDSAAEVGLHTMGRQERELLEHASMLHDVGTFLAYHNHHRHTYYLIRNADLLGFDQGEIALMAATARFHRKSRPGKKHPEYAILDKPSRRILRPLAMFLRLAESLDRSHASAVTDARFEALDGNGAVIALQAERDCQLEIWGVRSHTDLFKRVFGRTLDIRLVDVEGRPKAADPLADAATDSRAADDDRNLDGGSVGGVSVGRSGTHRG